MITEEQQTRVQYESTKESPIVTGDRLPYPYQYTEIEQIYMKLGSRDLINKQDFTVGEAEVTINIDVPVGEMVTIYRRTPLNQGSEFPQESKFSSKKIEDALDKLTLQNIEQQGALDRTIKFAISAPLDVVNVELPLPEAGKTLVWNKEENGLINSKLKVEDIVTGVIDYTKRAETAAENAEASNVSAAEQAQIATTKAQEATDVVVGFDAHAAEKQNAFDINAATLTARYDNNDLAKTNAFNQNAADKQELVDASANAAKLSEENAKKYAKGTIEEYPEGSSKYWSEKAKGIVVDSIIDDSVISTEKTYSSNKIEEALKKSGAGMPVGTIFSHSASSKFVPENCLPCDGSEYTQAQFDALWKNWLINGYLETCTYAEYQQEVSVTGECLKFALDTAKGKFKVPTKKNQVISTVLGRRIGVQTASTVPVRGNGTPLGLQLTGGGAFNHLITRNFPNGSDLYYTPANGGNYGNATQHMGVSTNNSQSGLLADTSSLSATVDINGGLNIQYTKVRYFVVVATGSINQSEMDWSAWASGLDGKVNRTGDTMTGTLSINSPQVTQLAIKAPRIDSNYTPPSDIYDGFFDTLDANGELIGRIYSVKKANGENAYGMQTWNKGKIAGVELSETADGYGSFRIYGQRIYSFITEGYVNGTSGYNLYSDGFCEQWGRAFWSGQGNTTITLLKKFKNTDYSISATPIYAQFVPDRDCSIVSQTTSSFVIFKDDYESGCHWRACGYI